MTKEERIQIYSKAADLFSENPKRDRIYYTVIRRSTARHDDLHNLGMCLVLILLSELFFNISYPTINTNNMQDYFPELAEKSPISGNRPFGLFWFDRDEEGARKRHLMLKELSELK